MNIDILLVYLIALVCLIFVVVGILIWVLTSSNKNKKPKQQQLDKNLTPQSTVSKHPPLPPVPQPATEQVSPPKDKEMLRVFRDVATGAIYIDVEGQQYRQITDIRSPEIGRIVLQIVADLGRFTRGVTPAVQPGAAAPATKPVSLLQPQAKPAAAQPSPGSLAKRGEALSQPPGSPKVEPQPRPPATSGLLDKGYKLDTPSPAEAVTPVPTRKDPVVTPPPLMPKEPVQKVDVGSFWGRILSRPGSSSAGSVGPRPLADELEDVLQDHMGDLTEVPVKEIHFRTATDGTLSIEVGGVAYSDMEALPDQATKDIVRAVVRKWERK